VRQTDLPLDQPWSGLESVIAALRDVQHAGDDVALMAALDRADRAAAAWLEQHRQVPAHVPAHAAPAAL
jgi:hypothetical protein